VLTGTCAPLTFSGRSVNATGISDRLRETTAYDAANEQGFERVPFRQHYRQWFTSCTIPAGSVTVGRYYVQVRSNPNTSALPGNQASVATATPTTTSGGHNRFALRAGFGSSGVPNGANVGIYGEGRLPIYVNVNATAGIRQANFYLARMTEEYAGEVVALTFFDIGDVSAGDVDFSVTPPPDSNIGASFTGCSIIRDGVPTLSPTVTNCGVQNMTSGTYNGRAVSVQIPIPTTYTCNEADRFGCWIRVRLDFDGAAQPTDTTTWSAAILGDPVRLVE